MTRLDSDQSAVGEEAARRLLKDLAAGLTREAGAAIDRLTR